MVVACVAPTTANALKRSDAADGRSITFPVVGSVRYADDFGECRDGCQRRHEGIDIMGTKLQHEVAAVDGRVVAVHADASGRSGNTVTLESADGWTYVYRHVNNDTPGTDDDANPSSWRFGRGISIGARVHAGQLVAYLGDSGNAESSAPHLHFEVRTPDGTPVDPYATLRLARRADARGSCRDGAPPRPARADVPRTVTSPSAAQHLSSPRPAVALAPTPSGQGYWVTDDAGDVSAYGDARARGDAKRLHLDAPIIDLVPTTTGNGYWLLAEDGGIFSYGDAHFYGSPAQMDVHVPLVAMAASPGGQGYWVLARDGEVFNFGNARFFGAHSCTRSAA
jgi:peptidase M23-like protein